MSVRRFWAWGEYAAPLLRGRPGYILRGQRERKESRMSETRLVCRVCGRVFSEH